MHKIRHLARSGAILLGLLGSLGQADAQATRVSNTATLTYGDGAGRTSVSSNTVSLDVAGRTKVPTRLSFRLFPLGYELTGLGCITTPTQIALSAPVDEAELAAAKPLAVLDVRQPLIMVLEDTSSNKDPAVREVAYIKVDDGDLQQQLRLLETAPDTGVFAGGVPGGGQGDTPSACDLRLGEDDVLRLSIEEDDDSYGSAATALVDPAGHVFDSTSGALVDGVTVTLLDADDRPATVYGDDGVTRYPSTVVSGADVTDADGRVYPGTPGYYRFPLTAPGVYHYRLVPPARYTAPSTASRTALAALKDEAGARFRLNDGSFAQAFTVEPDKDFVADIPVDPVGDAALLLTKLASVRDAAPGDFIQYRLQLANRGTAAAAAGTHITDTLPPGLRYQRGSARGGDEPQVSSDGRTLDFAIPALAAGASTELRYVVTVAPGAPVGEALNRAQAIGAGGTASNVAAASVRLRALLFTDALTILGRVTEGPCGAPERGRRGVAGIRLLMEDGMFVVTDRDGLYHIEGVRPGRHVVQLDTASIPASLEPALCQQDTRQGGNPISRFVEGAGGLVRRADFQLRATGKAATDANALLVAVADDATAAGNHDWMGGQKPGIDWLFPAVDHNPRSPALRVVIKHLPGQRVALSVNGVATEALAFDGTDSDKATGVAISRWTGVPLIDGDNRLVARVLDGEGREVRTLDRIVHVAGAARKAEFVPARSRLVADGLIRPVIAVRVTDRDGRPVRAGTMVPFRVDQPYTAAIEAALEQGRQLAGRERAATVARVVGDDGLAFLALQPTTQAGAAHVVVSLGEDRTVRTSEVRAWLAAAQKSWTVVGFGAGTLGYDTLSRHGRALPRSSRRAVTADGQLALYAKGRIRGSWLLTLAYDSDHAYDPDRGLLGTIDPDRYYTVYGDGSRQAYDAPTRRKLYLRLERREFYALFGDFESGFTETQLTRYSRTLNGVKAAYEGRRVRAAGFAAHSDSRYARDEIQGNGLSGPYRLSGRDIVPNSDKLTIEVRDRFRSEKIVSSVPLTRHIDYDIDTDLGTVRFRSPVLSRDAALNPVFIVAEYEIEGGRSRQLAAAARVSTKLAHGAVEVGASVIRDQAAGNATVAGVDLKAHLGRSTELRGEIAGGGRGGLGNGIAYLVEAEHHGAALDLLGYARQQDAGFGVGQQNLVEAGTRKIGFDGKLRLGERFNLTGTAWHQTQLDTPGTRIAGEARLEYRNGPSTLFVGGQFAADRGLDGGDRDSRLLIVGGSKALFDGRLLVSGQTGFAPGGDRDSVDFPVRHQITAAYRVSPGTRLIGGYEIAEGRDFTAHTAQLGFDVAPWTGAKLMSTLNQQAVGENGQRTFAQYGLSQSLPLGKRWTIDATVDASTTVRGHIDAGAAVTPFQPVASGGSLAGGGDTQSNGNYAAITLGATYRAERWSWTGRLERRGAEDRDRWGLTNSMLRTLGEGRTLASSVKAYRSRDRDGAVASYLSGDVALALRPLGSRWSLLERFELRHERADGGIGDGNALGVSAAGVGDEVTSRAINNFAVNYRSGAESGHGVEASVYYGAKYVRGRYADDVHDGFIDVIGFDLRQDISSRADLGVQASVQHAWTDGATAFSAGPSIGVSPAKDVWLTAGFNVAGYRDRDFEDDRYTRRGPYVTMRLKFDQASLGGAARSVFGRRR